ncbi:unnamed protein product [Timema podura]|uniref:Mff-like domain-containing protein n=1 Tax=Timema podura TaxID=61482 RepID=A0ABN7NWB5_TIMPD|nr:unnamed protein product [Timema podura]
MMNDEDSEVAKYVKRPHRTPQKSTGQDQHFGTRAPPRELLLENSIMPSDPGSVRVAVNAATGNHPGRTLLPNGRRTQCNALRESTPPLSAGDSLTTNEEITHLRRQMAKMNRRMMALELDSLQRQQREKFLYAVGLAYFLLKTVLWLGRS